jgi:hypothetical protein
VEGLFTLLMCADCQAARGHGSGPYPVMTRAGLRVGLDLMATWALEQKAAASLYQAPRSSSLRLLVRPPSMVPMAGSRAAGQRAQRRDVHARQRAAPDRAVVLAVEPEGDAVGTADRPARSCRRRGYKDGGEEPPIID